MPATSILKIAAAAVVAAAALFAVWTGVARLAERNTTGVGQGDYTLTATDGTNFTEDTLKGQPTAVFFGFTHCPDVCPTTLGDLMNWQDDLGEAAQDLRIVFVTVDPERDTLPLLNDYVSWLPGAVGVTGEPDQVRAAVDAFRVYAEKAPLEDGDYTMQHSSKVLLFDRTGTFTQTISYQEDPATAVQKLREILAS